MSARRRPPVEESGGAPAPELLARLRDGDAQAFAEIFRAHHAMTWRIAAAYLRREVEREEAVQEIWIRIHARRATVDPARAPEFRAFVAATARHHCIDRLRAASSRPESAAVDVRAAEDVPADVDLPAELASAELQAALDRFRAGLDPSLQQAYDLLIVEELEPLEAGRRCGKNRIQMRYLKRKLLDRLRADPGVLEALGRSAGPGEEP